MSTPSTVIRPVRFDGERRRAVALVGAGTAEALDAAVRGEEEALLGYGLVDAATAAGLVTRGWTELGAVPVVGRRLRVGPLPLVLPRGKRAGVRELLASDPRFTRLWDRFSVDVPIAVERNAAHVNPRVFPEDGAARARVLVFEDGDRYVIRALCMFTRDGVVKELLHDRSLAGMSAASHLLGLALREMLAAGAERATAIALPHGGSTPILVRHLFTALGAGEPARRLVVLPRDPEAEPVVARLEHWYVSGLDLADG